MNCLYYRAVVTRSEAWFFVAILRSFEHLAFDRTYDRETSTFEIFLPELNEEIFLELMDAFMRTGVITELIQLPNRLLEPNSEL